MLALPSAAGAPHQQAGLGLRKLHPLGIWEARAGIKLRFVFRLEHNTSPDQFTELARFPAMEGKTWNHPVLLGDRLLRNGNEMVAFRLSLDRR